MAEAKPVTNKPPTNNHLSTHQGWYYLALAVGSLVLGLGIFGGVGLLQSHGLISISKPVASFLGKLGATPHHVSLWVTAVGGISAGGALCGLSIYNISKKNRKPKVTPPTDREVTPSTDREVTPSTDREVAPSTDREVTQFDSTSNRDIVFNPCQGFKYAELTHNEWVVLDTPTGHTIVRKSKKGNLEYAEHLSKEQVKEFYNNASLT